jgi:hypothetical protein
LRELPSPGGIDAEVLLAQCPALQSKPDRAAPDTHIEKLTTGNEAVLAVTERGNHFVRAPRSQSGPVMGLD